MFECNEKLSGDEAGQFRKIHSNLESPMHILYWETDVLHEKYHVPAIGLGSFCGVTQPLHYERTASMPWAAKSCASPAPSSSNKVRDWEQKWNGECRTWTGQHDDRHTIFFPIIPSASVCSHRWTYERSTYPSQCRDKAEKSSAQKRLKVPAVCTGTCLPPATSSSLQPHNTASSQRPSGNWVIPVT